MHLFNGLFGLFSKYLNVRLLILYNNLHTPIK